jgi:mannosyltransferase
MDEGFSAFMAQTDFTTFMNYVRHGEINMVAYYGLLRLWTHFGRGEAFIRSLSVLASAATIPLVYMIGKRLMGVRVGIVAALLLAVHPGHVQYAQEARSYALGVFLLCLFTFFLLRCLYAGSVLAWVGYAGALVLAVYTFLLTCLVALSQWPVVLRRFKSAHRLGRLAITLACSGLFLLPIAFVVWSKGGGVADWIRPVSWHTLGRSWRLLTLNKFGFLYALAWLAGLWAVARKGARRELRWSAIFLGCWLVLPVLFLLAISLYKPMLIPRLVLMCVPAGVLLAAVGLESMPRLACWIGTALLVLLSLVSVRSDYRRPKEDWRGVTARVVAESRPGDAVIVVPQYGHFTFDYYRQLRGVALDRIPYSSLSGQIVQEQQLANRLWLIVYGGEGENRVAQAAIQSVIAASDGSIASSTHRSCNTSNSGCCADAGEPNVVLRSAPSARRLTPPRRSHTL